MGTDNLILNELVRKMMEEKLLKKKKFEVFLQLEIPTLDPPFEEKQYIYTPEV